MAGRSILIIGAGIGGLAAGCYARMNGYSARIVEAHYAPGGCCTSWTHGGYTFDGCIHNLGGTSADSALHTMWRELGAFPARAIHNYAELVQVERADGAPLTLYADLDRLERHLKELAPIDAGEIGKLMAAARRFADFDLLGLAVATPLERLKASTSIPLLAKWGLTLEHYAERFRDPFLRAAIPSLVYDWPNSPAMLLLNFLGRLSRGDYGWPVGGSGVFAHAIEKRYRQLGGEIRYKARAQSIIVENGRAAGVRLEDSTEERADIVISNANGYSTIFGLLGGRFVPKSVARYYSEPVDRIEMGIHVSLGVARDLSKEPHAIVLPLAAPIKVADEERKRLYIQCFGYDKTLAPTGKSVLKVLLATSFRYWEELARNSERYAAEKKRVADAVIGQLGVRFPGITRDVEVTDVATPMTTLRYTGNGCGYKAPFSRMAMALFTGRQLSARLPGLDDFYMVGQWAGTPGVSSVAAMGRSIVRDICTRDRRRFATEPSPHLAAEPSARAA